MWGYTINVFLTWFHASRWRKASKCKTLISKLQSTLKIQRRRRECMVRQSRADIAQLRRDGRFRKALHRAEQIFLDEGRLSAYNKIECFCKCILENFCHFKQQSDVHLMPDEVKEAVAGLIFAASRVGELPELQSIRALFRQRFGHEFDRDSVELCPGNLVGSQIEKSLETKPTMPSEATQELLMEIANNDQTNTSEAPPDSATSTLDGDDDQLVKANIEKKKKLKMVVRVRVWLERMNEKMKMMQKMGNLQHVHPNLPEYEDLAGKLRDSRTDQRRRDLSEFPR